MTRMIIVSASVTVALAAAGCGAGSTDTAITVPASANSKTPLPKVETVRESNHVHQALEGAIARSMQWANQNYGKSVLDQKADNMCKQQVEDLWYCYVTVDVVKPFKGYKRGPRPGVYTVTRDTQRNQLIYIPGTS